MVINSSSNNYPFITKKEIAAKLSTENGFIRTCLILMQLRTEERKAAASRGITLKAHGFMSSHEERGRRLATKLQLDEPLTETEMVLARTLLAAYPKQLAAQFRQQAVQDNPALADAGRVFGV